MGFFDDVGAGISGWWDDITGKNKRNAQDKQEEAIKREEGLYNEDQAMKTTAQEQQKLANTERDQYGGMAMGELSKSAAQQQKDARAAAEDQAGETANRAASGAATAGASAARAGGFNRAASGLAGGRGAASTYGSSYGSALESGENRYQNTEQNRIQGLTGQESAAGARGLAQQGQEANVAAQQSNTASNIASQRAGVYGQAAQNNSNAWSGLAQAAGAVAGMLDEGGVIDQSGQGGDEGQTSAIDKLKGVLGSFKQAPQQQAATQPDPSAVQNPAPDTSGFTKLLGKFKPGAQAGADPAALMGSGGGGGAAGMAGGAAAGAGGAAGGIGQMLPMLAMFAGEGDIANKGPQKYIVGERGPEAVVPLTGKDGHKFNMDEVLAKLKQLAQAKNEGLPPGTPLPDPIADVPAAQAPAAAQAANAQEPATPDYLKVIQKLAARASELEQVLAAAKGGI
jgi:hypothetical protein